MFSCPRFENSPFALINDDISLIIVNKLSLHLKFGRIWLFNELFTNTLS